MTTYGSMVTFFPIFVSLEKKEFEVDDRVLINLKILSDQEGEIIDILDKGSSKKFLLKILNSNHAIWVNQDDIHHI